MEFLESMLWKRILCLCLVISSFYANAQNSSINNSIAQVDSLLLYCDYDAAAVQTKNLYQLLYPKRHKKEFLPLLLKVKYQQAVVCHGQLDYIKSSKLAIELIDAAKQNNLYDLEVKANLLLALNYEISAYERLCWERLQRANHLIQTYQIDSLYSTYCIRKSSYYRQLLYNKDSIKHYADLALHYAHKYQNIRDIADAHLMLGHVLRELCSIEHYIMAARYFMSIQNYETVSAMLSNIALKYTDRGEYDIAGRYIDSLRTILKSQKNLSLEGQELLAYTEYRYYESLHNVDSAYHYFQMYHRTSLALISQHERSEIRNLEIKYEIEKAELIVKSRNNQLIFISTLLSIIAISSLLVIRKNRKINKQNKVITKQVEELVRTLDQKNVLLSELQHRVKNNLQHVISILEIQKESVDFNNIDELIRGNQNRIHSMALLHKKLNVSENVNDIDLGKYISELAELVKDSYDNYKKKTQLHIRCTEESISIEKALPIGLIIVELVSNSMKHAFKQISVGIISIQIEKEPHSPYTRLHYSDNGCGFNFNLSNGKGLGIEIIKGLIGQLDATARSSQDNGFELTLHFKLNF